MGFKFSTGLALGAANELNQQEAENRKQREGMYNELFKNFQEKTLPLYNAQKEAAQLTTQKGQGIADEFVNSGMGFTPEEARSIGMHIALNPEESKNYAADKAAYMGQYHAQKSALDQAQAATPGASGAPQGASNMPSGMGNTAAPTGPGAGGSAAITPAPTAGAPGALPATPTQTASTTPTVTPTPAPATPSASPATPQAEPQGGGVLSGLRDVWTRGMGTPNAGKISGQFEHDIGSQYGQEGLDALHGIDPAAHLNQGNETGTTFMPIDKFAEATLATASKSIKKDEGGDFGSAVEAFHSAATPEERAKAFTAAMSHVDSAAAERAAAITAAAYARLAAAQSKPNAAEYNPVALEIKARRIENDPNATPQQKADARMEADSALKVYKAMHPNQMDLFNGTGGGDSGLTFPGANSTPAPQSSAPAAPAQPATPAPQPHPPGTTPAGPPPQQAKMPVAPVNPTMRQDGQTYLPNNSANAVPMIWYNNATRRGWFPVQPQQ